MLNPVQSQIEAIASETGWDSFIPLLLISRWLEERRLARDLIEHLNGLAAAAE